MFGRRRDNGASLDGNNESSIPGHANDPDGAVIPLDAHIRLGNPAADPASRVEPDPAPRLRPARCGQLQRLLRPGATDLGRQEWNANTG